MFSRPSTGRWCLLWKFIGCYLLFVVCAFVFSENKAGEVILYTTPLWFTIFLAYKKFLSHEAMEKKKATISVIEKIFMDRCLEDARIVLYQIHYDQNIDIKRYAKKDLSDKDAMVRRSIFSLINCYEGLGVGIKEHIYDISILSAFMKGSLTMAWKYTFPLISELRDSNRQSSAYENFENLVKELETQKN